MKRIVSVLLALLMLFSAFYTPVSAYSASKMYAVDKLQSIQTQSGFIPGKTASVTGNCYAFVSKVCEKLYGVKYDGEGLYGNFRAKHQTGNYYTVGTYTTKETYPSSSVVEGIISFFVKNAVPGDVIHYGAYTTGTSNSSTHTMIVQSIDSRKIGFFHANYQTTDYSRDSCHVDYVYWDSLRSSPTSNEKRNGKIYSMNSLFYNKMKSTGLGISINRYSKYEDKYYLVGATTPIVKVDRTSPYSMRVYWDEIAGATKYQVQYKKASAADYITATSSCKALEYEIKNLDVGVKYDFRVRTYAAGKWQDWSNVIEKKTLPPTMVNITFSLKSNGLSMKWGKRSDITGVRIYKSTKPDGDFTQIKDITNLNTNTYLDKDIEYDTTYYYRFERYLNLNGNTYATKTDPKSAAYVLAQPTLTSECLNTTTVQMTLTANGTSDSFVYYLEDSKGKTVVKESTTANTAVTLKNLTPCTYYYFYAAQKTAIGRGEFEKFGFRAVPGKVENLKTARHTKGVQLSFTTQSDANGYTVYRSTAQNGAYNEIKTLDADEGAYLDTDVKYNTVYYYKVRAFASNGSKSYSGVYSDIASGKNTTGKVTGLKIVGRTPTSFTLKWTKPDNAESYTVQMKPDGGSWKTVGNATGASKVVSGLKLGKVYYFRVKANNSIGSCAYCAAVSRKTFVPKPKAPTSKVVSKGLRVYWQPESYATGYKIYRATSKNGSYKLVKTVTDHTTAKWTDTSVSFGKGYYYKIVCYKTSGKKTYNSSKSDYVYKKCALAVPKLKATANGTNAELNWGKVEGADKYVLQYRSENGSYKSLTVTECAKTIVSLTAGTKYYFRVKAVNKKGSSSYCTAQSVQF